MSGFWGALAGRAQDFSDYIDAFAVAEKAVQVTQWITDPVSGFVTEKPGILQAQLDLALDTANAGRTRNIDQSIAEAQRDRDLAQAEVDIAQAEVDHAAAAGSVETGVAIQEPKFSVPSGSSPFEDGPGAADEAAARDELVTSLAGTGLLPEARGGETEDGGDSSGADGPDTRPLPPGFFTGGESTIAHRPNHEFPDLNGLGKVFSPGLPAKPVTPPETPPDVDVEERESVSEVMRKGLNSLSHISVEDFERLLKGIRGANVYRDYEKDFVRIIVGDKAYVFGKTSSSYQPDLGSDFSGTYSPAYWSLIQVTGTNGWSIQSHGEFKELADATGRTQTIANGLEFTLRVIPFGTIADKSVTGEGGEWGYVIVATVGDVATVASFGLSAAAKSAQAANNINKVLKYQKAALALAVGDNLVAAGYDITQILGSDDVEYGSAGDLLLRIALLGLNAREANQLRAQLRLRDGVLDETAERIARYTAAEQRAKAALSAAQWRKFVTEYFENVASGLSDSNLLRNGFDMIRKVDGKLMIPLDRLDDYITASQRHYPEPMNDVTENWIRSYIRKQGGRISTWDGLGRTPWGSR